MHARILVIALVLTLSGCSPSVVASPWSTQAIASGPTPTAVPTPKPTPASVAFSLMDFNIEYGGVQVDFGKIVEAARASNADVIALEEAEGNTRRLAEEAGYPHANIRNQIISRFPIVDPPGADGRYVYIEVAPGAIVAVSNVHLPSDPYGPYDVRDGKSPEDVIALEKATRLPAIQDRLAVLPALAAAGIPTFLTGDFNAPSHLDWTAAAVGVRPHIRYPLAWPVSTAIELAGFRDTYREIHPDPVTHPGLTWWAGRPLVDDYPDHADPQDRIDIIYAAGPVVSIEASILGEGGGPGVDIAIDPWGTDHRAVLTTFMVTPGDPAPYVGVDERLVTAGGPILARYHGAAASLELGAVGGTSAVLERPVDGPDGTWEIATDGLPTGDYEVRLVGAGGVLAAFPVSIAAAGATVTLTADEPVVPAGAPIGISWRDAPGSRWDWIGIYPRGGDPLVDDYLSYVYTGQTVRGSVVIDATGEGEWPLPAGDYDAHYLLDDGYTSLASTPFTVSP